MNSPDAPRIIHIGAVVLNEGRVLLVRQTPSHSLGAVWTIPWGVLDRGETPSAAAMREVLEESGVSAEVVGLVSAQSLPAPWEGTIALVFLCTHVSGEPSPDGVETDQAAYFSASELQAQSGAFETWSRWLVERVLAGHTHVLRPKEGNPFGSEGFIA
jgi:ADP-ribose pyrophosphatase YjhB (NUDIX family)